MGDTFGINPSTPGPDDPTKETRSPSPTDSTLTRSSSTDSCVSGLSSPILFPEKDEIETTVNTLRKPENTPDGIRVKPSGSTFLQTFAHRIQVVVRKAARFIKGSETSYQKLKGLASQNSKLKALQKDFKMGRVSVKTLIDNIDLSSFQEDDKTRLKKTLTNIQASLNNKNLSTQELEAEIKKEIPNLVFLNTLSQDKAPLQTLNRLLSAFCPQLNADLEKLKGFMDGTIRKRIHSKKLELQPWIESLENKEGLLKIEERRELSDFIRKLYTSHSHINEQSKITFEEILALLKEEEPSADDEEKIIALQITFKNIFKEGVATLDRYSTHIANLATIQKHFQDGSYEMLLDPKLALTGHELSPGELDLHQSPFPVLVLIDTQGIDTRQYPFNSNPESGLEATLGELFFDREAMALSSTASPSTTNKESQWSIVHNPAFEDTLGEKSRALINKWREKVSDYQEPIHKTHGRNELDDVSIDGKAISKKIEEGNREDLKELLKTYQETEGQDATKFSMKIALICEILQSETGESEEYIATRILPLMTIDINPCVTRLAEFLLKLRDDDTQYNLDMLDEATTKFNIHTPRDEMKVEVGLIIKKTDMQSLESKKKVAVATTKILKNGGDEYPIEVSINSKG